MVCCATLRRWFGWTALACLLASGCRHTAPPVELPSPPPLVCEPLPIESPAGGQHEPSEPQLIDLTSALRLANVKNPNIAFARERIREALAQQDRAEVLWLPHLELSPGYLRHDGQLQRSTGEIITVSRSALGVAAGPALRFDWSDALFAKLASRQITEARLAGAAAVSNNVFLDVALTYTDLLQTYAEMRNADETYEYAKKLYDLMVSYEKAEKVPGADVARARVEFKQRERERISLQGKARVVSARLAELVYLPADALFRPVEAALAPLTMVPADIPLSALVVHGLRNRPDLAEHRAQVEASLEQWRSAKWAPWVPELQVFMHGGGFGGGKNGAVGDFDWRSDSGAAAYWRLDHLGLGNRAVVRERESQYLQSTFRVLAVENTVAAQIVATHGLARSSRQELAPAKSAYEAALESAKLNLERIQRAPEQGRPIELLQAIQAFQRAQADYVQAVADYNRAQFRLYTALGNPPQCALEQTTPIPEASIPLAPPTKN